MYGTYEGDDADNLNFDGFLRALGNVAARRELDSKD